MQFELDSLINKIGVKPTKSLLLSIKTHRHHLISNKVLLIALFSSKRFINNG